MNVAAPPAIRRILKQFPWDCQVWVGVITTLSLKEAGRDGEVCAHGVTIAQLLPPVKYFLRFSAKKVGIPFYSLISETNLSKSSQETVHPSAVSPSWFKETVNELNETS